MIYLIWLLRIIHIVGGVFWVGGSLTMTFFIGPTIGATADAGQKFVQHLMNNLKFSNRMSAAAGLTVLAGVILYGLDARAGAAWQRSSFALGLSIGAGFAMAQLGAQFKGKPTNEQMTRLQAIRKQQATYSNISTAALILAVIFMAIARYLNLS